MLFIDLDNFKLINNNYGHSVGDRVLVEVARRLSNQCRENDLIARSGGDEFIIAAHDIDDRDAAALAERVLRAIREPLRIDDRMIVLTASAGLASNRLATHASAETLLSAADLALYAAKDAGRARAAWFDKALLTRAAQRVRVDTELRRAIEQEELVLYFQPSFELPRLRLVSAEALVRWRHPTAGLLPPSEFINAAEEAGLISDLGDWVIHNALEHRQQWCHLPESFTIWVNVSVRQLQHPDFAQSVEHALRQHHVPPQQLGIEITEYALADEVPTVAEQLHALRAAGVRLAIDDFGTGYSSLSRLRHFPVDVIKIDRSFVSGIATDTSDKDIVATIMRLARTFGSTTLAEGVETGEQLQALVEIGCDAASGYYLGRPTPSHDFIATQHATTHHDDRSTPRRSG